MGLLGAESGQMFSALQQKRTDPLSKSFKLGAKDPFYHGQNHSSAVVVETRLEPFSSSSENDVLNLFPSGLEGAVFLALFFLQESPTVGQIPCQGQGLCLLI